MTDEPFVVKPHMGLRRKRLVDTGLDAVLYKQSDWPEHRLVALAERVPGAALIMMATMSESEIAKACKALTDRGCDGAAEREIVHPRKLEAE